MGEQTGLNRGIEAARDIGTLLREVGIAALVVAFFFFPGWVSKVVGSYTSTLHDAGVTKIKAGDKEIDFGAASLADVSMNLPDLVDALKKDPSPQNLLKVEGELNKLQSEAQNANELVKGFLVKQDTQAAGVPTTQSAIGWLFAGRKKGSQWDGTPNVGKQVPVIATNDEVMVTRDVYLRADEPSNQHTRGSVVKTLRAGVSVKVLDTDCSNDALSGGCFLWLKAQPE